MMNHATTELFFDDLRVPAENLIGEEGQGFPLHPQRHECRAHSDRADASVTPNWFIAKASAYAKERVVFGRPIGQDPGRTVSDRAQLLADAVRPKLMVREAAARYEAGRDCGAEANMAKLLAADASWDAADMCMQTYGGFGFAEELDTRAQVPRDPALQTAPVSTKPDPVLSREHDARPAALVLRQEAINVVSPWHAPAQASQRARARREVPITKTSGIVASVRYISSLKSLARR